MSLGGGLDGPAPVGRREEAEGDRNAGVEVQIDFGSGQENSSRMPFDVPKGRQEGVSCFFGRKKRREESVWLRFWTRLGAGGGEVIDGKGLEVGEGLDCMDGGSCRWMEERRARVWKALLINRWFVDSPVALFTLVRTRARAEPAKRLT